MVDGSAETRLRDRAIAVVLFLLTFTVFSISPIHQIGDSKYTMLVSEALLRHGTFQLDRYFPKEAPVDKGDHVQYGPSANLETKKGHVYYYFPLASSVLSAPFVALAHLAGVSAETPDGRYDYGGECKLQGMIAPALGAALAVVFFWTARLLLLPLLSATIALVAAFGTQIWSTTTRALWGESWGTLLVGLALYLLLGHELRAADPPKRLPSVWLATLLSLAFFTRPTNAVFVVAVSLHVLSRLDLRRPEDRTTLARYLGTGALWAVAFVAWSYVLYGQALPNYFRAGRLGFEHFLTALAANLVSPGRSELLFVPVSAFVVAGALVFRRRLRAWPVARTALLAIAGYFVTVSAFVHWWGGDAYGPRYFAAIVPWLVLLAVLVAEALRAWMGADPAAGGPRSTTRRYLPLTTAVVLSMLGVAIHARGATSFATERWNMRLYNGDPAPLWDFRSPQILAGLVGESVDAPVPIPAGRKPPAVYPPLGAPVRFGTTEGEPYCWYGFSGPEGAFRWTDGKEAALVFSYAKPPGDVATQTTLELKLSPLLFGSITEQRVDVDLDGHYVGTLVVRAPVPLEYDLVLPDDLLMPTNVVTLHLPFAASPLSLEASDDPRTLGVAIHSIALSIVTVGESN